MASAWHDKIQKYDWVNHRVTADSREKSWTQFYFCENPHDRNVRNVRKYLEKTVALEIGQR